MSNWGVGSWNSGYVQLVCFMSRANMCTLRRLKLMKLCYFPPLAVGVYMQSLETPWTVALTRTFTLKNSSLPFHSPHTLFSISTTTSMLLLMITIHFPHYESWTKTLAFCLIPQCASLHHKEYLFKPLHHCFHPLLPHARFLKVLLIPVYSVACSGQEHFKNF